MRRTAYIYTDEYARFEYGETHPLKPYRLKLTHALIESYGLLALPACRVVETVPATRAELETFHTPEYLDVLEAADLGLYRPDYAAYGLGPGDNPIFPGMYRWSQLCAGGTLQAARLVASGEVDVAFHSAGGLHHGMPDRASGFCYINDPVLAIGELVRQGYRVAYIDIDVHHGDGVQAAFYDTDRVLTISLHESGRYLFPGTGFPQEIGEGKGRGYAVNLPFPPGMDDALYLEGFLAIVPPLVAAYQPDIVFTQLGVDAFHDDPLAHGNLTTAGFLRVLEVLKALARRWVATGGGGYNLANVARAWTLAWGVMNDVEVPDPLPEAVRPLLARQGYHGQTLRDRPLEQPVSPRQRQEVAEAIAYLKRHVFPLHGLPST
ncbi:MAG: acetoin utilization protein AcuC [Candidatus Tectimicrobiota bacterium]|nr:MAG: acetoin utilization protein AcuC [Candidatus Tectomicrobia bacterium]